MKARFASLLLVAAGLFGGAALAQTPPPPPVQTAPMGSPPAASPVATPAAKPMVAPGGGPGLVWVNSKSHVYHCYGSKHYGTTKHGSYMSEADAKAQGNHGVHGKTCS